MPSSCRKNLLGKVFAAWPVFQMWVRAPGVCAPCHKSCRLSSSHGNGMRQAGVPIAALDSNLLPKAALSGIVITINDYFDNFILSISNFLVRCGLLKSVHAFLQLPVGQTNEATVPCAIAS